MKNTIPEVDAYIEKAAKFAQPILKKIRRLFHKAFPKIDEAMKWSTPAFMHKGIVAGMAAFKQHVRFAFWKGKQMKDPKKIFEGIGDTEMGALVLRDVSELPPDDVLMLYIKEAVELNEQGVKSTKVKKKAVKKELAVPDDLAAALKKNKKAQATFDGFSPSHKREYIEWITEAKQEATRKKRLATAIEWLSEGKPRNWKYMKKW